MGTYVISPVARYDDEKKGTFGVTAHSFASVSSITVGFTNIDLTQEMLDENSKWES